MSGRDGPQPAGAGARAIARTPYSTRTVDPSRTIRRGLGPKRRIGGGAVCTDRFDDSSRPAYGSLAGRGRGRARIGRSARCADIKDHSHVQNHDVSGNSANSRPSGARRRGAHAQEPRDKKAAAAERNSQATPVSKAPVRLSQPAPKASNTDSLGDPMPPALACDWERGGSARPRPSLTWR